MDRNAKTSQISRRTFLATTGAMMVGAAWGGGVPQSEAAQRHPKRGGVLRYSSRGDASGLDAHMHNQLHNSHPTAVMYTSLTDLDYEKNIIPGIAES
jgi:hypothetical protein